MSEETPTTPPENVESVAPLIEDVRGILRAARQQVFSATNQLMVLSYWRIGRRIVEEEQSGKSRADYGMYLIRNLARGLGDEFGHGISLANLKNFRQFYLVFPDLEKGYALRSQLTWSHWRLVMRVENSAAREFYISECASQNWTTRQLERAIASAMHLRSIESQALQGGQIPEVKPRGFVRDPYVLEFLGLPEPPLHEHQLEDAIVLKLRDFLMELGRGFSFVGRQFRISTETSHFFVDLVFYNYILKCFVLIDLKTRKLDHGDIGQMDMYVRLFDDLKRGADDNPTLGIIFCTGKDETLVRYSVLSESRQLFASRYRLVLPSEEELREELERRHILELPHEPPDEVK